MEYNDAVVGFSVNPEIELAVEDTPGPKKVLRHMEVCLSGSSGNVSIALNKLGVRSHLLGLVAADGRPRTVQDVLLDDAIKHGGVSYTPIPALTETNACVIPVIGQTNGEAWGKRNHIVHSAVPTVLRKLSKSEIGIGRETFTIITGLRAVEVVFAKALLTKAQVGFRVLNAKDTFYAKKEFRKVPPLVDLLVLNKREFNQIKMGLAELHNCGPRIIVVTHDKEGGWFSFRSGPRCHFRAVSFPGGKFETGAGDWFLGALVAELIRLRESASTVKPEQFHDVINFAATVAGKKITMPGGGNGPSRRQLR